MITIYLDQIKDSCFSYVEDRLSSHQIISMNADQFREFIMTLKCNGQIHSCHPAFINHFGRFVREIGECWLGTKWQIMAKREDELNYTQYTFNTKGQIENWPFGFFG